MSKKENSQSSVISAIKAYRKSYLYDQDPQKVFFVDFKAKKIVYEQEGIIEESNSFLTIWEKYRPNRRIKSLF